MIIFLKPQCVISFKVSQDLDTEAVALGKNCLAE